MSISGGSSCGDPTAFDGGEVDDTYGVHSRAKRGVKTNWKTGPANLRGWDKASVEEEKAVVMERRVLHGIVQSRYPTESHQISSRSSSSNAEIRLASISRHASFLKAPDSLSSASSGQEMGNHIGRTVVKEFPNQGLFNGKVTAYDDLEGLWQVTYSDGDQEEYAAKELESYLIPEIDQTRPLAHQLFKFSSAPPSSGNVLAEEGSLGFDDSQTYPCFKCSGLELASKLLLCDGCDAEVCLTCANLDEVPADDANWFCYDCELVQPFDAYGGADINHSICSNGSDRTRRAQVWNRVKQTKITGSAAPYLKNLQKYLDTNPDCELYMGQISTYVLDLSFNECVQMPSWLADRKKKWRSMRPRRQPSFSQSLASPSKTHGEIGEPTPRKRVRIGPHRYIPKARADSDAPPVVRPWVRVLYDVVHHKDPAVHSMIPWSSCGTKLGLHADIATNLGNGNYFRATGFASFAVQLKTIGFVRVPPSDGDESWPGVRYWFTMNGLSKVLPLYQFAEALDAASMDRNYNTPVRAQTRESKHEIGHSVQRSGAVDRLRFVSVPIVDDGFDFSECAMSLTWLEKQKQKWRLLRRVSRQTLLNNSNLPIIMDVDASDSNEWLAERKQMWRALRARRKPAPAQPSRTTPDQLLELQQQQHSPLESRNDDFAHKLFAALSHEDSQVRAMLPWSSCGTKFGIHEDMIEILGNGRFFAATGIKEFGKQLKRAGLCRVPLNLVPLKNAFSNVARWYTVAGLRCSMNIEEFVAVLHAELQGRRLSNSLPAREYHKGGGSTWCGTISAWMRCFYEVLHDQSLSVCDMLPWSPCGKKVGVHDDIILRLGNGVRFENKELMSFIRQLTSIGFVRCSLDPLLNLPGISSWFCLEGLSQQSSFDDFTRAVDKATALRAKVTQKEPLRLPQPTLSDSIRQNKAFPSTSFNECVSSASWLAERKQFWSSKRPCRIVVGDTCESRPPVSSLSLPPPAPPPPASVQPVDKNKYKNPISVEWIRKLFSILHHDDKKVRAALPWSECGRYFGVRDEVCELDIFKSSHIMSFMRQLSGAGFKAVKGYFEHAEPSVRRWYTHKSLSRDLTWGEFAALYVVEASTHERPRYNPTSKALTAVDDDDGIDVEDADDIDFIEGIQIAAWIDPNAVEWTEVDGFAFGSSHAPQEKHKFCSKNKKLKHSGRTSLVFEKPLAITSEVVSAASKQASVGSGLNFRHALLIGTLKSSVPAASNVVNCTAAELSLQSPAAPQSSPKRVDSRDRIMSPSEGASSSRRASWSSQHERQNGNFAGFWKSAPGAPPSNTMAKGSRALAKSANASGKSQPQQSSGASVAAKPSVLSANRRIDRPGAAPAPLGVSPELWAREPRHSSHFTGVGWHVGQKCWVARVSAPGAPSSTHLGNFATELEAARAYDAAARIHGKPTNFRAAADGSSSCGGSGEGAESEVLSTEVAWRIIDQNNGEATNADDSVSAKTSSSVALNARGARAYSASSETTRSPPELPLEKLKATLKGTYFHARDRKWHAKYRLHGKAHYIGTYLDEVSAARAYDARAVHIGLPLNFPDDVDASLVSSSAPLSAESTLHGDRRSSSGCARKQRPLGFSSEAPAGIETDVWLIPPKRSSSHFFGVGRHAGQGVWTARLRADGRDMQLGSFDTELEAAKVYDNEAHSFGKVCNFVHDSETNTFTDQATSWLVERATTGAYTHMYPKMPPRANDGPASSRIAAAGSSSPSANTAADGASGAKRGADGEPSSWSKDSLSVPLPADPNAPPNAPAAVARSKRNVAALDYAAVAAGPKIPAPGPRMAYNKEWKPGAPWRP